MTMIFSIIINAQKLRATDAHGLQLLDWNV